MVNFSPKIGRIAGIDIQLHWISILFLLLILISDPTNLYLFYIFVAILVCIFLHELAHSLTALHNNVKVKKIILILPIGGGSIIDPSGLTPEKELRITAVGPMMSILIALVFGILVIFTPAGLLKSGLQLLFELNILLGVLNFMPWFPLDGGRMLRSYLQRRRPFFDATKTTVDVSKAVTGIYVIGSSAWLFFLTNYSVLFKEFAVIINLVLAMFIYSGAQAEMQYANIRKQITGMTAQSAISKGYVEVKPTATMADVYKAILKGKTHLILYKTGDKVRAFSPSMANVKGVAKDTAASIAGRGTEIPTIAYNAQLYMALDIMRTEESSLIAVIRNGKITGIITAPHLESVAALKMSSMMGKANKT